MTREEYADLLLPGINITVADLEKKYSKRDLPEGAMVTRYAPSPTGFVHIGALLSAFISTKMAKQSNGVSFLRIEDTDTKRTVENGVNNIIKDLKDFGMTFDEGVTEDGEKGNYGPYMQSKRKEIYWACAKELIIQDKAYPCFCTPEEVEEIREKQRKEKKRIGYYGIYAKCRHLTMEEAIEKVKNGEKYIIRLKSNGHFDRKRKFKDLIKGKIMMPENDVDEVIIKSDGLPTYHFAHCVDDHFMRTTHVIRGDEWLNSLPLHSQLFYMFGWEEPKYAHISPLMIDENGHKRKLSKRKDPEFAVSYYKEKGIPNKAVMLYLETVTNSNFEAWLNHNKGVNPDEFKLDFKKMPTGGTLFDEDKLLNISKNYISSLKAEEVYSMALEYAKNYDKELYDLLDKYKDYSIKVFNIERQQKKPRKDLAYFKETKDQIWYMYDELFKDFTYEWQKINDLNTIKDILKDYKNIYDLNDTKDEWFNKIRDIAIKYGYAPDMASFKEDPNKYNGDINDISMVIRVCLTSKSMTPDLYQIMNILGKKRIDERIDLVLNR